MKKFIGLLGCGIAISVFAEVPLPLGYTELAYIESTGGQYINTNYKHKTKDIIVCDFEAAPTQPSGCNYPIVFGAMWGNGQDGFCVQLAEDNREKVTYVRGSNAKVAFTTAKSIRGRRVTLTCNQRTATWSDGEDSASCTFGSGTSLGADSKIPMLIFQENKATVADAVSVSQNWWPAMKLYSFKITSEDGTVQRDYIPCRNRIGEAGLWDKQGGRFYANQGSGVFKGGDGEDEEIGHIDCLLSKPVASSPGPYFNTGYNHKIADKIVCDVMVAANQPNPNWPIIYGAMWNNNTAGYCVQAANGGNANIGYVRGANQKTWLGMSTRGERGTITTQNRTLTWTNGTTTKSCSLSNSTSLGSDSAIPMTIFVENKSTTPGGVNCANTWFCEMTLWGFDIISEDGTWRRKLVPWRLADGTVCMYDHVTKTVFPNQGPAEQLQWSGAAPCGYTVNDDGTVLQLRRGRLDDLTLFDFYTAVEKTSSAVFDASTATNFPTLTISKGRFGFIDGATTTYPVAGALTLKGGATLALDVSATAADRLDATTIVLDSSATVERPFMLMLSFIGITELPEGARIPVLTGGGLVAGDEAKFQVMDGAPVNLVVENGNLVLTPRAIGTGEWTGAAGTTFWDTPGNWLGDTVPEIGANVSFPLAAGGEVKVEADDVFAHQLTFGPEAGDFTFLGSKSITVHKGITALSAGAQQLSLPMFLGTAGVPFVVDVPAGGTVALSGSDKTAVASVFVKRGEGLMILNDDTVGAAERVDIEAGTLRLANRMVRSIPAVAGEIHVPAGTQLDVNANAGNQASLARTEATHGKTVYIEGDGPDGAGAVVNSQLVNAWGCTFGHLVVVGDASVSGGNLSVRPLSGSRIPGSTLEGPGTLTIKGPNQFALHTTVCDVGGVDVQGYLQFEGNITGTVTNGVALLDGSMLRLLNGATLNAGIPVVVPAESTALLSMAYGSTVKSVLRVDGTMCCSNQYDGSYCNVQGTLSGNGRLEGDGGIRFSGADSRWVLKADDTGFTEKVDLGGLVSENFLANLGHLDVVYTGAVDQPKVLVVTANCTIHPSKAANVALSVVDGEGEEIPNCWLGVNAANELELHIADANVVKTAIWTGYGREGDITDPANWSCSNEGGAMPGALPMIATEVTLSGSPKFDATAEHPLACASVRFDNVQLAEDRDWSGIDLARAVEGSVIDLKGHTLAMAFGTSSAYAATVTDTCAIGQGGTLRLIVPEGAVARNSQVALTGSLQFAKEGAGTYIAAIANPGYAGGTDVRGGTIRCTGNGLCLGMENMPVTVQRNAMVDFDGYGNQYYHPYVLNGGTLRNEHARGQGNYAWWGSVTLTDDSFILAGDSGFGFVNLNSSPVALEMNGHTLRIDVAADTQFAAKNLTVTGGGTIHYASGGWFSIGGNVSGGGGYLRAPTTRLVAEGPIYDRLGASSPATFLDYVSTYSGENCIVAATSAIEVSGRFQPGTKWFNVQLKAGATIDLSDQTGPWVTECAFEENETVGTVEWAEGRFGIDLGSRYVKSGDCVIRWNTMPENFDKMSFKLLSGGPAEVVMREDGVYVLRGLTLIVR